jgi:hypothetical protein
VRCTDIFRPNGPILAEITRRAVCGYHQLFDRVVDESSKIEVETDASASLLPMMAAAEAFIPASGTHPGAFAMISATTADPRALLTATEAVHIPPMMCAVVYASPK